MIPQGEHRYLQTTPAEQRERAAGRAALFTQY
jgi:hypothetical protein